MFGGAVVMKVGASRQGFGVPMASQELPPSPVVSKLHEFPEGEQEPKAPETIWP